MLPSCEPRDVFDELGRASAGGRADYSGITYERLRGRAPLYWPVPTIDHPGTPVLFTERFATADGYARFIAVTCEADVEKTDSEYPWTLTTGRVREHYLSGTQTRRVARLGAAVPEPIAEIHPSLAHRHRIADGAMMRITSRRGFVELRASYSEAIRPELIFTSFHWGGNSTVNNVIGGRLDPHSKMPPFKACAVKIQAVTESDPTNA